MTQASYSGTSVVETTDGHVHLIENHHPFLSEYGYTRMSEKEVMYIPHVQNGSWDEKSYIADYFTSNYYNMISYEYNKMKRIIASSDPRFGLPKNY